MLRNFQVDKFLDDLAAEFNKQIQFIKEHDYESGPAHEAAWKDSVVGTVNVLHKHIVDFSVDKFYADSGYPGARPFHTGPKARW